LALARQLGYRFGEVLALWGHLTEPAERDQADSLRRDALKIYEELGIPVTKTVRAVSASSTVDPSDSQPIV
jgi:hypothetical protein